MKGILEFFKPRPVSNTASMAKDRLQLIIAKQSESLPSDLLAKIQSEILDVIKKYIQVQNDAVSVNVRDQDQTEILELNITFDRG